MGFNPNYKKQLQEWEDRRKRIVELSEKGLSYNQIAKIENTTYQNIQGILARYKRKITKRH